MLGTLFVAALVFFLARYGLAEGLLRAHWAFLLATPVALAPLAAVLALLRAFDRPPPLLWHRGGRPSRLPSSLPDPQTDAGRAAGDARQLPELHQTGMAGAEIPFELKSGGLPVFDGAGRQVGLSYPKMVLRLNGALVEVAARDPADKRLDVFRCSTGLSAYRLDLAVRGIPADAPREEIARAITEELGAALN